MEILFENETEFGKIERKIFKKFIYLKYDILFILFNYSIIFTIVIVSLSIYFLIWIIWRFIEEEIYILALVFSAAIIFGIITRIRDEKKKQEKKLYKFKYEFYDEYITIHVNNISNTFISTNKIHFKEIFIKDICEYKGYIFLMQSKIKGWIINENNFTIGNKEEFNRYIQDKFNRKIKYYN